MSTKIDLEKHYLLDFYWVLWHLKLKSREAEEHLHNVIQEKNYRTLTRDV